MINELFNTIEFSVDWGLLFGLISILSLVITWLVKSFRDSDRELIVKEVSIENLLNKPNELVSNLKIILNGQEIEQLNRIELYIQNYGAKTLNIADYHILPRVNLSGFTNITSLTISASNEFTKCESNEVSPSLLELKIDNLEPKDYVRIEILFESLTNEFESYFEFRLKEQKMKKRNLKEFRIDKHFGLSKDYNGFMIMPVFAGALVFGLTYFIVIYRLKIDISDPNKFSIGWKALYFLPTILTGLFVVLKWNKTIKDFHFGYKKVDKWHFISTKE